MKLQVTKKAEHKFKKGYPLIQKEDLQQVPAPLPTDWLTLIDSKGQRLAEGYLGEQNKGIGWLLSWHGPINQSFFQQLFEISREKRTSFKKDSLTTAYRLFNGEGDGIGGLIIDRYADYAVFSWYNETLYQKKAELLTAFRTVYPDIIGAYEKIRFSTKNLPESQFLYGEQAPEPLLVTENGVQFATYLNEGLMTGIFLDQKEVRGRLVDGFAVGKTVLNMFSYTGAFSVAAAMGGAVATTSVDLAKRSLPKTTEQFEVNHLNLAAQKIIVMDVFDYFKYASRKGLSYDMIILDPPSFARNKKKVFSVAKNYGELVKDSIDILTDKGTLIASTNAANLSLAKYQKMVITALQEKNVRYKITDTYQLPADFQVNPNFPEGNYLKVLFIEIEK
ncbi:class I SAM-dependent rRNA methyltransferase [Enterococcus faecalis]|jgi:23S rRNA (cytosine1962-C5)-methyltransferase|uniref:class I SAM-dependent rRNA methyltransferase n=1 Tax=Enterococcus TaxID=1350 RepID=UPI00027C70A3|nr:class I SAM-dependent rRNA methyltransferase [Enterococcus faecalis]EGO2727747.1 class I SAM-dependent rRNA methyltransferase [Enterococcus faecalis]EGO2799897.1 class I SAM-dependent rRNA methyltransferase [Enterococcus faecalis]EGO2808500.1 class I SAM-dependent rRNA methyltransferase [Enterococcus faecalis]EGO5024225.1 class I SAM-dependent rRNA methyltransferase [Enterococcus faecalis]EGO6648103.1 class I SAM-dependent rRNA methyltransferase [Enterococcus faecalis]